MSSDVSVVEGDRSSPDGSAREQPVAMRLPGIDCIEKIVIAVDLTPEMNTTHFRSMEKKRLIHLTKRAIHQFLQNKHSLNRKHEFALLVFREKAEWLVDFQSNPEDLMTQLEHNFPVNSTPPEFDLSELFDCLYSKVQLPKVASPGLTPSYIIRTVMVFGRSQDVPLVDRERASFNALMKSPHFFLDVVYVHEKPNEELNKCMEIYTLLCQLDETENTYVLEVSSSMTRLLEIFSILLAHPLQRAPQADACYSLTD